MDLSRSQDQPIKVIAALLSDVQALHSEVFSPRACRLTIQRIIKRYAREGIGFLTKTLPRLGKLMDMSLSSEVPFDPPNERKLKGSKLPKLFGELFECIFDHDGRELQTPCVQCVKTMRDVLYLFYKYELPYDQELERKVLTQFEETEKEVATTNVRLGEILNLITSSRSRSIPGLGVKQTAIIRRARVRLNRLLQQFDPKDIIPCHGPGAVSTKEKLWGKWFWSNIPDRLASRYEIDQYFYCNLDHVCDELKELFTLGNHESPARVILVPKDSRGPRLISCEPLYLQWIQQGISQKLVRHVERHHLTMCRVNFTDQTPNRIGALLGSQSGRYSTLDLAEASDRISMGLVRLLFPEWFIPYLEATRSLDTQLPDGRIIRLEKFAPMGSALCFPILALSIWAILTSTAADADTRERILVYGDDVIVPTKFVGEAIEQLTYFGLKVNQDKSCTKGFFRESCGMDAYRGVSVTPVRLRTVWSSTPSPGVYTSWIAYANQFYNRRYYNLYDHIVKELVRVYGPIPEKSLNCSVHSLEVSPVCQRLLRSRYNKNLQKRQWYIWDVQPRKVRKEIDGWKMLLRYFTEGHRTVSLSLTNDILSRSSLGLDMDVEAFTASTYTRRRTSKLVRRWR